MLWATDYPHPTFPRSREVITTEFAGVPDHERVAMTSGNAAARYRV